MDFYMNGDNLKYLGDNLKHVPYVSSLELYL